MLISYNKITNIPTLIGPPMTLLSSNCLRYLVRYSLVHLLNIQDPIQNSNYKPADSRQEFSEDFCQIESVGSSDWSLCEN